MFHLHAFLLFKNIFGFNILNPKKYGISQKVFSSSAGFTPTKLIGLYLPLPSVHLAVRYQSSQNTARMWHIIICYTYI